jgi:protein LSM12
MSSSKSESQKKGSSNKGSSSNNNNNNNSKQQQQQQTPGKALLAVRYPVNSTWEFTLPNDEIAAGTVYCTDETSQIVVLQKSLVHTTLAFEVRMVQVSSIKKEKLVSSSAENSNNTEATLSKPLPVVQKKALEEREKRAIRLAEESFQHINQNVSL